MVDQWESDHVMGVDLDVTNVTVGSTSEFRMVANYCGIRNHYLRLRQSFQTEDTWSAKRVLGLLSGG